MLMPSKPCKWLACSSSKFATQVTQQRCKQLMSLLHSHASLPSCLGNTERRGGGGGQWDHLRCRRGGQRQCLWRAGGLQVSPPLCAHRICWYYDIISTLCPYAERSKGEWSANAIKYGELICTTNKKGVPDRSGEIIINLIISYKVSDRKALFWAIIFLNLGRLDCKFHLSEQFKDNILCSQE